MTALALTKLKKFSKNSEYPPRIFKCNLETILREKMAKDYSVNNVAAFLGVTPITMRNVLKGGTISLENAIRLSELVSMPITDIWQLR